ncbi:MAG: XRE family transcriptional regulator [Akkermansia sp.]|nr:XRE family transcriptional regulator [Akkermansia sp.]
MNTDSHFTGQLRNRRKMKRLSLRALSAAIGGAVSHEMLARYEKGLAVPGEGVRQELCRVLGIVPGLECALQELQGIRFRARYALPQKEQDAIVAAATERFNLYREVEARLGLDPHFHMPFAPHELQPQPGQGTEMMEDVAEELRRRWNLGLGPLPNMSYMLEHKGIKIYEAACSNMYIDGFSAELAGEPLVCLADWLNTNVPRKRMTLAHELGHIIFPWLDADEGSEEEYFIAHFAGAFLVPRTAFLEAFGSAPRDSVQLGELLELKHYFGASLKALMVRAWQLGVVSDEAHGRFRAYYDRHRYLDAEPGKYAVPDRSERYQSLVAKGVLCGCISPQEAAGRFSAPPRPEMDVNLI